MGRMEKGIKGGRGFRKGVVVERGTFRNHPGQRGMGGGEVKINGIGQSQVSESPRD